MLPTRQGSIRLFRLAGIDVFLHWSWFVIALYEIQMRGNQYSSTLWNALEYLALFMIVLMHEFGHALACRQVGGQANQIILWPLGGVAYVSPPQRPGAVLWSIAAGPLVNVVLAPVFGVLYIFAKSAGLAVTSPNVFALVQTITLINLFLLIFNLLPIYPLDGGQILRSLLWFAFGRARSLMISTVFGFVGVLGLGALAFWWQDVWLGILCVFILFNCFRGLAEARVLTKLDHGPKHNEFSCPSCKVSPPVGNYWLCGQCRNAFDTFASGAVCPHCGAQFSVTRCPLCGGSFPMENWRVHSDAPPKI